MRNKLEVRNGTEDRLVGEEKMIVRSCKSSLFMYALLTPSNGVWHTSFGWRVAVLQTTDDDDTL